MNRGRLGDFTLYPTQESGDVERFGDFIGSGRLRDRPVYRREGCVILGDLFKCFQLFMLG